MQLNSQVIILFLLILIGYIARKTNMVSDKLSFELSSLVVNITLPLFIFTSMNYDFSPDILAKSYKLIIISFIMYLIAFAFAHLYVSVFRFGKWDKAIYEYILIFPNVGYMGYPILNSLYGSIGVFYGAVFNLSFNILVWSYGIHLMRKYSGTDEKPKLKERLKATFNPGMIAVLLGFVMFLTSMKLPETIYKSMKMVGDATTPLSMMVIGFILTGVKLKDIALDFKLYIASFFRLIIIPISFYILLKQFVSAELLYIPTILFAMPGAVNTAIIAQKYDNNYTLASKLVFVSTLLSIATIPFIIKFFIA